MKLYKELNMNASINSFILHCGEMGSRWGFNRTTGQMAALLLVNEKPLSANDIVESLNISRGNVSMGIKELVSWRLIKVCHIPGERKDYYETTGSIWDMANRVINERKKREIEPTLDLLATSLNLKAEDAQSKYAQQKMQELHELLSLTANWSDELQKLETTQMKSLMKMGARVSKFLSSKNKLMGGKKAKVDNE